jgi:hypothetical protein
MACPIDAEASKFGGSMVMAHLKGCEEHIGASGIARYEAVDVVVGREANA